MSYNYTYNGQVYTVRPSAQSATLDSDGMLVLGDTYQVLFGMSDEEATACHAEGELNHLRYLRNEKLKEWEWTQTPDVPTNIKNAWLKYRQERRDITDVYTSQEDVIWPTKPE